MIELVGHANRAHSTIEEYLLNPVPPEPKGSTYFSQESIAQRGRESVVALGDDPKVAVAQAAHRTTGLVEESSGDATIGSPLRTMTLNEYLPSRTAELTIHGLDLVRALDMKLVPPEEAVQESLAFVAQLSARRGNGEVVLRALSGRGELPTGFTVF